MPSVYRTYNVIRTQVVDANFTEIITFSQLASVRGKRTERYNVLGLTLIVKYR